MQKQLKQLLKSIDERLEKIEKLLFNVNNSQENSVVSSYKEVIDEWLNGKTN